MTDRLRRTVRRSTAALVGTVGIATTTVDPPLGIAMAVASLVYLLVSFVAGPWVVDRTE